MVVIAFTAIYLHFLCRLRALALSLQTELATIWLAAWAIREPGILDPAASKGLSASLPLGSQQMTDAMVSCLEDTFFGVGQVFFFLCGTESPKLRAERMLAAAGFWSVGFGVFWLAIDSLEFPHVFSGAWFRELTKVC